MNKEKSEILKGETTTDQLSNGRYIEETVGVLD